jgi:serine/threonine-protein kinase
VHETRFAPGERVGRYRLERLLGEGATGLVYLAADEHGGAVAVKLLHPDHVENRVARARLLREAKVVQAIDSRHVASVLDVGELEGRVFLVMPYYAGGSLACRVRERGRLELDETAGLAAQLGRGLDALHERGVLHRDIKPSNVLLEADGTAALADFGLARAPDSTRLTRDGQLLGTPYYLAPELIEGREASRATDVYALGCLLYECLAGRPPFTGSTPGEIGYAHLVEAPPDPRELRPDLDTEAALALLTALEKEPSDRPSTATALARMLAVARMPGRL